MFLYNVHTPQKTFALTQKEGETRSKLFERVWSKAGSSPEQKKDTTLLYEFEGERWSLDDDDDLEILLSRFPPSSTPSVTIHLQPPPAHAHFHSPPSYSSPSVSSPSSKIKSKSKPKAASKPSASVSGKSDAPPSLYTVTAPAVNEKPNGSASPNGTSKAGSTAGAAPTAKRSELGHGNGTATQPGTNLLAPPVNSSSTAKTTAANTQANGGRSVSAALSVGGQSKAKSVMSTRSRKSKWGDDDAEPLGDVRRREWEDFHNNNGVRTVVGKVNGVPNVRMLLKSGYRHVYISRSFAVKHGIVPKKFGMGSFGYTGLKTIGNVDITVGNKTASHQAYMSEETHFDVILGRAWLEKMAIKIDALDPTALTYMDSGEPIPCEIVVLKDDKGQVITIT